MFFLSTGLNIMSVHNLTPRNNFFFLVSSFFSLFKIYSFHKIFKIQSILVLIFHGRVLVYKQTAST